VAVAVAVAAVFPLESRLVSEEAAFGQYCRPLFKYGWVDRGDLALAQALYVLLELLRFWIAICGGFALSNKVGSNFLQIKTRMKVWKKLNTRQKLSPALISYFL
jgi:hypothetical protein